MKIPTAPAGSPKRNNALIVHICWFTIHMHRIKTGPSKVSLNSLNFARIENVRKRYFLICNFKNSMIKNSKQSNV